MGKTRVKQKNFSFGFFVFIKIREDIARRKMLMGGSSLIFYLLIRSICIKSYTHSAYKKRKDKCDLYIFFIPLCTLQVEKNKIHTTIIIFAKNA